MNVLTLSLFVVLVASAYGRVITNIVGGSDANPGEFPYQGSLQLQSGGTWRHICGCVLYAPNRALTAAHCLTTSATFYRVAFGEHSISGDDGTEQLSTIDSYTIHPNYSPNLDGFPNDTAVLRLSTPMDISAPSVDVVTMPTSNANFNNQTCTVTGWGRMSGGGPVSDTLKKIDMNVMLNTDCAERWSGITGAAIDDVHICGLWFGANGCDGDNGGPFVCGGTLAGTMSWGLSSCEGSYPTVFVRISEVVGWIESQ